jgi:hypothetical protein
MTTKKQVVKKTQIDIGLRLFPYDAEEITRAVEIDARARGVFPSRNAFCAATVLAAARKIIKESNQ